MTSLAPQQAALDAAPSGGGVGPEVVQKASASAWIALAILIATTLFAFVDRQIINLVAPSLQRDLGLTDLQLGIMHGVGLALFASAAAYPIGWLSDRFGRRLVLGCCIAVWSASTAACAFQTTFGGIFTATAGIAIGEAALTPIIFSMIPDLFPERQRNTANFIFFAVALLGVALGLGLGGLTLQWLEANHQMLPAALAGFTSWQVALILVALPGPLFIVLLGAIRLRRSTGDEALHEKNGSRRPLDQILPFLRAHWLVFACIYGAIAAYTLTLTSAFAWLPVAMPRMFATVEASSVGIQLGIAVGAGSVIGLCLAPAGLKFMPGDAVVKPLNLARILLLSASVPTALMLFAWQPWQIYAAVGVQLALMLATGALVPGILQQLSPPGLRSRLLSILGIVSAIAGGAAPLIVGALSGFLDPNRGLLIAIVGVSLPGWILAALLMSSARRPFARTLTALARAEPAS